MQVIFSNVAITDINSDCSIREYSVVPSHYIGYQVVGSEVIWVKRCAVHC